MATIPGTAGNDSLTGGVDPDEASIAKMELGKYAPPKAH